MEGILTCIVCIIALIVILIVCLRGFNKGMKDMKIGFGWLKGFEFSCSFFEPKSKK